MWRRLIFGVALLVVTAPARAQEPPTVPPPVAPCTFRTLPVTVLDKNGEPITSLTAADFRAEFRGRSVNIVSVGPRSRPLQIAILVDHSRSQADAWSEAVRAVDRLLQAVPSEHLVALLFFSDKVSRRVDFGQERSALVNALASFPNNDRTLRGKTALWDALWIALDMISSPEPGDVLYVVSNAGDSKSNTDPRILEERMLETGVRLFFLPVETQSPELQGRSLGELVGPSNMVRLIEASGGGAPSLKALGKGIVITASDTEAAKLHSQIFHYYELQIELPTEVDKKRGWKLQLTRAKELGRPTLLYPQSLVPCQRHAAEP